MWMTTVFLVLFTLCQASINESAHEKLNDLQNDVMGSPAPSNLQQTVNVKVGQTKIEMDTSKASSREEHGKQLVFLPFFRNNYRRNPSTFQRRTGGFFYRPLRKHCYYHKK